MADKYLKSLDLDGKKYRYYDIKSFAGENLDKVPYSLRVLLENMMRYQKMGFDETVFEAICDRENKIEKPAEIPFHQHVF